MAAGADFQGNYHPTLLSASFAPSTPRSLPTHLPTSRHENDWLSNEKGTNSNAYPIHPILLHHGEYGRRDSPSSSERLPGLLETGES